MEDPGNDIVRGNTKITKKCVILYNPFVEYFKITDVLLLFHIIQLKLEKN